MLCSCVIRIRELKWMMKLYLEYWLSESCEVRSPVNKEKLSPVPKVPVTSGIASMAASMSEIGVSLSSTFIANHTSNYDMTHQ